jgi:HAD superfamily hydrolase (TIGR01509 family)
MGIDAKLDQSNGAMVRTACRTALLDIDGTLVDSNEAHARAWDAACAEFGFVRSERFFRPLIGMGSDQVLPRVDPALSDDRDPGKAIAARRGEIFKSAYLPTLRATPGARALVERIHTAGLRCVVASSAKADELEALLDIADVTKFIDVRTTADDAARSKPAPDIVIAALKKAGAAPNEAVFLGDTPYDITSGRQAGVSVIGLRCGGWDDLGLAGAIAIYNDPADLLSQYDASPLAVRS